MKKIKAINLFGDEITINISEAKRKPTVRKGYADAIPLARYGTVDEIASAVGFLCSPQASYITGQTLAADAERWLNAA